jgi:hypothetical protein
MKLIEQKLKEEKERLVTNNEDKIFEIENEVLTTSLTPINVRSSNSSATTKSNNSIGSRSGKSCYLGRIERFNC